MLLKLQQEYQQKPWVQQETVAKPVAPDDNIGDKSLCPEVQNFNQSFVGPKTTIHIEAPCSKNLQNSAGHWGMQNYNLDLLCVSKCRWTRSGRKVSCSGSANLFWGKGIQGFASRFCNFTFCGVYVLLAMGLRKRTMMAFMSNCNCSLQRPTAWHDTDHQEFECYS